jgi:hypothetical protein
MVITLAVLSMPAIVVAEYGDVLINNYSDAAGMRPVVFPHLKIIDGEYCGACHNGEVAWSVENCDVCHTGISGQPTQVHQSTDSKLSTTTRKKKAEGTQ